MPDAAVLSTDLSDLRRRMVDCQLRTFSVTDETVLAAVQATPRELFVGPSNASIAYSDASVVVAAGSVRRTLLTPMVLARLLQGADLSSTSRVLDVGGATGYSACVMSRLCGSVVALESEAAFSDATRANAARLGLGNVAVATGPLNAGAAGQAPFDVILVNGAVETGLEGLCAQLADGGRLLTIRRSAGQSGLAMRAVRYDKAGRDVGMRVLFDASAPVLDAFRETPGFVF